MFGVNVRWVYLAPQNIPVQLCWHLAIKLYCCIVCRWSAWSKGNQDATVWQLRRPTARKLWESTTLWVLHFLWLFDHQAMFNLWTKLDSCSIKLGTFAPPVCMEMEGLYACVCCWKHPLMTGLWWILFYFFCKPGLVEYKNRNKCFLFCLTHSHNKMGVCGGGWGG